MPKLTLDLKVEEIKNLVLQLPEQDLLDIIEALQEQVETLSMMGLAETGFHEWNEEGEDIYDAKTKTG